MARFNNSSAAKRKSHHSRSTAPATIWRSAHSVGAESMFDPISDVGHHDLKQCPRCRATMFLHQILPKFGPVPETWKYRCPECRCVAEVDMDEDGHPVSAIKLAGLSDWLGTRRVVN